MVRLPRPARWFSTRQRTAVARIECRFADETLWLSQSLMAELFLVTVATINEHIKNIIAEGEVGLAQLFGNSE